MDSEVNCITGDVVSAALQRVDEESHPDGAAEVLRTVRDELRQESTESRKDWLER
jgi:hypothetical protein